LFEILSIPKTHSLLASALWNNSVFPPFYHPAHQDSRRLFINLTPCIPLSLERRGGIDYVREASPLFDSALVFTLSKGRVNRETGF